MPVGMHHRLTGSLAQLAPIAGQAVGRFDGIKGWEMMKGFMLTGQGLINRGVERVAIKPRREKLLRHQG